MTEDQITKAISTHISDAMEYSEQLSRYVLDDLLTDDQESHARQVIHDEATLSLLCDLAPVLGIMAPALEHARAVAALNHLFETEWGSGDADDEDQDDEE